MKKSYFAFIVLFTIAWTHAVAQTTYYVKTDGDDSKDGKSWANAKKTIAAAITAVTNPAADQIFVKKGTYTATSGNVLFTVRVAQSGLKLYGGFAGTETSLSERVFGTTAADSTNLVGNGNRVIFNYAVVAAPITNVTYDGFTITGGEYASGAGMQNSYASVTIANCIFKGNKSTTSSGGGIYNTQNTITVTNCKFYSNVSGKNGGGGILLSSGSSGTITNCTFDSNKTNDGSGAGVSTYHTDADNPTSVSVINCTFTRNAATGIGGGIYNYQNVITTISGCTFTSNTATSNGGAMYNNPSTSPAISNCTFTDNTATVNGGGMYNNTSASPTITDCTFSGNTATTGGGMYNYELASPVITNCTFSGNSTTVNGGGAMYNYTSTSPTVTYCTFTGNETASGGCVLNNTSSTAKYINCLFAGNKSKYGGALYNADGATPSLTNCTIAGNNGTTNGGGIYSTGEGTVPVLTNCIVYDNSNGIVNVSDASATVTYSVVQYTGGDETDYSSGTGNLNVDPKFTTSPAYSTAPFSTGGDYSLQNPSPAINAGNNSAISAYATDLAASPRRYADGVVDMGAYEYQGVLSVKLNSFTVQKQGATIQLNWSTASETNNSHFEVLRSDGSGFKVITTVQGNGTSNQAHLYSYTDAHPLAGVSYYQLRQVDVDGQSELSEIIPVRMDLKASELKVYASAAKRQVAVWFYTENAGAGKITITDVNGRKIASGTPTVEKGYNKFELPAIVQKGINILALTVNGEQYTAKFIAE